MDFADWFSAYFLREKKGKKNRRKVWGRKAYVNYSLRTSLSNLFSVLRHRILLVYYKALKNLSESVSNVDFKN
jgi:hypothetical protein